MRLRIFLAAIALFPSLGSASAKAVSQGPLRAFFGEVGKVDLAAKTLTLKLGDSLVFRITDETKISGPGGSVSIDKIKPGEGATVVSRPGKANIGIAVTVRLYPKATFASEPTARTVRGETISGLAVSNLVTYRPPDEEFSRAIDFGPKKSGTFLLSVQPDGSVANVKTLKSLGYGELDARAARWFKKLRFRPNSVTEVQLPMEYYRTH